MNVDEALERADAEAYSTADVDALAAEVRRLRAMEERARERAEDICEPPSARRAARWILGGTEVGS